MARVAITAPPAITAISQMGRAIFFPTSCDSLSPLLMMDGFVGVVMGSTVTLTLSVLGAPVVLLDDPVLLGNTYMYIHIKKKKNNNNNKHIK